MAVTCFATGHADVTFVLRDRSLKDLITAIEQSGKGNGTVVVAATADPYAPPDARETVYWIPVTAIVEVWTLRNAAPLPPLTRSEEEDTLIAVPWPARPAEEMAR